MEFEDYTPDAWERNDPDWGEVEELVATRCSDHEIAAMIRDEVEKLDGDELCAIAESGLWNDFIPPEDRWKMKDPDDEWTLVDNLVDNHWHDDAFFLALWIESDKLTEAACKTLKKHIDKDYYDRLRTAYNDDRRA